ncbi:cellulose biosynthesis protein BcsF [Candidatus Pantoea soli]|uniref:Cellulose biosynthesis protein BcsF n=1 Tax=Candidatus Pantoea soli TaxID=3098669 RepID=A0A518X8G5_9GAMM|nr:cellulose biosynthesis protein BcsF [Pantoea soli]QDY40489.1 cellulose biosynthesis protein BcsF [Pantoea soli]
MTLMDWVQIAILLLLILLFFKSLWLRWLPRRSNSLLMRLLPTRALKAEGLWHRQSTKTDKHE